MRSHVAKRMMMMGGNLTYMQKLPAMFGASLIGYWPMNEAAGAVAIDYSGQGNNGAYTGVTLGSPGIGDGNTCPFFDGTNDYNDLYSAGLDADFDGLEGTFGMWHQVFGIGEYGDANYHLSRIAALGPGSILQMGILNNGHLYWSYMTNALEVVLTPLVWFHMALTWSKSNDRVRCYLNGIQQGADLNGLAIWSLGLVLAQTVLGSYVTTPDGQWHGNLAHAYLLDREATPTEVLATATV